MNLNVFHFLQAFIRFIKQYISYIFFHFKEETIQLNPCVNYIEKHKQRMISLMNDNTNYNENIHEIIYDKENFKQLMKDENEQERHWKNNIIFETTYREDGKEILVIMYYDLFKQGFAYHSDESFISHNVLNAVAMKYVNTYFCKDFFLDELFIEENEITYKSPLFAIFNDNETKKKDKNSHVFAKLKNYQDPRKTDTEKKEHIRNKFIHMGKIHNFSMLSKKNPISTTPIKTKYDGMFESAGSMRLSYKDYKNKLESS